jgi:phospholipid-binding lipoprotein MlaA
LAIAAVVIATALSGAMVDPAAVEPTAPVAQPAVLVPLTEARPAEVAPPIVQLPSAPPSVVSTQETPEDIVVTAKRRAIAADPLENINETSFEVIQSVDKAFVGPVAIAYREKIPNPLRVGIRNFLSNIGEPIMFVNFVLQLKPGKAAETAGRFAINSTLGIAGVMDVAKKKPFHLPHRVNGFAYTMGYYGIKSGPYLYLPFIGPTTLRDVTGRIMDLMLLPLAVGQPLNNPFYALPAGVLSSLDDRAEFDAELTRLRTQSGDPYAALRAYYLNKRQAEIDALRGRHSPPPVPELPQATPQP